MSIFQPITKELEAVKTMLQKEYIIKAGHLNSFAHLETTSLNSIIRPATVILSGRLFNYISNQVIALAAVVQFIYMASNIHFRITEDQKEDKGPKDGSQFPVLVGDYLYGKFFTSLCNAELAKYLGPLSQVICSIHEGGILRRKVSNPYSNRNSNENKIISLQQEITYKETGTLFETGCRISSELAGTSPEDQLNIQDFARELGTAYGLIENRVDANNIVLHIEKAGLSLNKLPQNKYHQILRNLLDQLQKDMPNIVKQNAIGS